MNKSLSPSDLAKSLVLIVDDDPLLRSLLRLAMEEEGYEVIEAKNGEQGLRAFQRYRPDLVLLDAMMPVMTGFECCQQLRCQSGAELVPILMITVLDEPESVDQAFAVGATDYVTKPIHWAVLSQRVRRLLQMEKIQFEARRAQVHLEHQTAWAQLISSVITKLHQAVPLPTFLGSLLEQVEVLLLTDRLLYWQPGNFLETHLPEYQDLRFRDERLLQQYGEVVQQQGAIALQSLEQAESEIVRDFLSYCEAKATLTVLYPATPPGYFCGLQTHSRPWGKIDRQRFADLATLLAIAQAKSV